MENQSSMTGWQELCSSYKSFQLSAAIAIATFAIYRLLNLNLCSFNFYEQNFPKVNYFDYMTNLIAKGLFD